VQIPTAGIDRVRRALSLAAILTLAVGAVSAWEPLVVAQPMVAIVFTIAFGVMLIGGVVTLAAREARTLRYVDMAVLSAVIAAVLIRAQKYYNGPVLPLKVDEGALMADASQALEHGHNPYLHNWPAILHMGSPTKLMSGGSVDNFGYPPLGAMITAGVHAVDPRLGQASAIGLFALIATAIFAFCVTPEALRPLVTIGVLGIGTLLTFAEEAYPAVIALPFIVVAIWAWPKVGAGGRLGAGGIVRAVCLGLGAATHQLVWFVAVFIIVGMWLVRRGSNASSATKVVGRYAVIAAGAFLAVNLPFIVSSPAQWCKGIFEVFTQDAVPHGQGFIDLTYYLVGGSGALSLYSDAAVLLTLAMLVLFATRIRLLGPAAVVLPWLSFYFSTRSQSGYFVLMTPIWIVGLTTVTHADFADAYTFSVPERLRAFAASRAALRDRSRTVAVASIVLFLPAAVCVGLALAVPQPLSMTPQPVAVRSGVAVGDIVVEVTDVASTPIRPHFALSVASNGSMTSFLKVLSGPPTLSPHQTALYVLSGPSASYRINASTYLRAVSAQPLTLSSVLLPTVTPPPATVVEGLPVPQ
jgi:hypothetical protein